MKKVLLTLISVFLLTISSCKNESQSSAQAEAMTDEQAVVQVEDLVQKVFDSIWSAMDTSAVKKYHTEDFVLLEHGEVWNNDTIINWAVNAKERSVGVTRINDFERIQYKRNGDEVWLAYHNYATIKRDTLERKLEWLESVVARRFDSVWKLEMMHSTRVPRPQ